MNNKKLFIIPILLMIGILVSGCSGNKITQAAEKKLSEKYDETFTSIKSKKSDYGSYYVWLKPDNSPNLVIRAEISEDLKTESDNYPMRKVCSELTAEASVLMDGYSGSYYIHTDNISDITFGDDPNITADEYLKQNPADRLDVSIFVEEGAEMDSLYNSVLKVRSGLSLHLGYVNVFIIPTGTSDKLKSEIEKYDDMAADEVQEIIDRGTRIFIEIDGKTPTLEEFKAELQK